MALQHAKPTEVVRLTSQGSEGAPHVALVKTSQFEAICLSLTAGGSIPAHHVPGYATVQCIRGSVELVFEDRTVTMASGDWLYLDRDQQHAVSAREDSTLLVTIMLER